MTASLSRPATTRRLSDWELEPQIVHQLAAAFAHYRSVRSDWVFNGRNPSAVEAALQALEALLPQDEPLVFVRDHDDVWVLEFGSHRRLCGPCSLGPEHPSYLHVHDLAFQG